jgi:phosphoenolpyruvate carboxylase
VNDPHAPLRENVNRLGRLLGERLRASEGEDLYAEVERVRALSKQAHDTGGREAFEQLAAVLTEMPIDRALPVARAFSRFLMLANIAEQHHRIRRRRDYLRDGSAPQRGSYDDAFARLLANGVDRDRLHDAVASMAVDLVFTAHPTEITRRTLLQSHMRIAHLLGERDRTDLTAPERATIDRRLREEVAVLWGTNEVRAVKPTPLDEVRSGLAVFEQTLWCAVPAAYRALDAALVRHTGRALPYAARPVRFSSWIGGDRDGNPNVTPDVTRRATLMTRWVATDLFEKDLDALVARLSIERASRELLDRVGTAREPYRAFLREVRDRLRLARTRLADAIESGAPRIDEPITNEQLREALALCDRSLRETHNETVAEGLLRDVRTRVDVFGLALAPLDIREDSAKHTRAIDVVSGGEYATLDEQSRQRWLLDRLARTERLSSEDVHRYASDPTLGAFIMAASLHRDSLGAYVITMASTPSDILAVEYLQQLAGISPPMRVVPLFETGADLHGAPATLRTVFADPWYRAQLDARGGRQEVMIGYSDSAKDAGRFAAAWDLYRAQEEIVATCREAGVKWTLFHGRGGSVGRGGGPTYLAIQSQPPGSIDGTLRVTEQGEMLSAHFGLEGIATRTLEVYVTATLEATLDPRPPAPVEFRAAVQRMCDASREAYQRTIRTDGFIDYFHEATPSIELDLTNIGSRPAKRRDRAATKRTADPLSELRAIPWQFAWTQTRLLLASWLGIEAIGDVTDLHRRMYVEWPFFRSTIDLIEMVLAKSDARIAGEYDRRLVRRELQPIGEALRRRLESAIRIVREITNHRVLVEENPVLRRSIDVRNPYVDPINLVQIELLHRLRSGDRGDESKPLESALVATVNGIAAGMRNTG